MKVAVSFPGVHRKGGVERVAFECTRFLASRGHEVHVVAQEWEPIDHPNVHFHAVSPAVRPRFLNGRRYFRESSKTAISSGCDVLNTHGCVCPLGGVQWVQSVHAAWLSRAKTMRHPFSAARIKQKLNPVHPVILNLEKQHFQNRAYKKLIATTPEVVKDLHDYYGVPETDVVVIPNGFNPTEFSPVRRAELRAAQRAKLGLAENHFAFLFVANELERKGYPVLLKALQQLHNADVRLLVIGRPPIKRVMEYAAQFGVENSVMALGPSSDVASMHAAADLFVLPTQYEAFALAILESLGSGLPVITTNVPGARDAIQRGDNGFVMQDPLNSEELANILRPLLAHDKISALSATTPATVEKYKWPNVLAEYEAVLEKCKK